VDEAGAIREPGVGAVDPGAGCACEPGDAARVAVQPRRLQVGRVAEAGERLVEGGVVVEGAPRRRLGVDGGGPQVVGARDAQQFGGRVEEEGGDRRVERAPRPARDGLGRERLAPEGIEHDARVADGGEPRRPGDLVARAPLGHAAAVIALEPVEHGPAHGIGQSQARRQLRPDLAVGARARGDEAAHARRAAQRTQAAEAHEGSASPPPAARGR